MKPAVFGFLLLALTTFLAAFLFSAPSSWGNDVVAASDPARAEASSAVNENEHSRNNHDRKLKSSPSSSAAITTTEISPECKRDFDTPETDLFHQVQLPKGEGGGGVERYLLKEALLDLEHAIQLEAKLSSPASIAELKEADRRFDMRADRGAPYDPSHQRIHPARRAARDIGSSPIVASQSSLVDNDQQQQYTRLREHRVWIWATDGTLLNLMRWGSIVNDNDVDLSFLVLPYDVIRSEEDFNDEERLKQVAQLIHDAATDRILLRRWYVTLLFTLVRAHIVDKPTPKQMLSLKQNFKAVKPRRCLLRRGMMQCRHGDGKVVLDFFGPENSFVGRPGFSYSSSSSGGGKQQKWLLPHVERQAVATLRSDYFPLRSCKAYETTFPCPKQSLSVLKSWSLDHSAGAAAVAAVVWNEFAGCALFTQRKEEHAAVHVKSILRTARKIDRCGFASLWPDRNDPACKEIIRRAGVDVSQIV